MMTVDASPTLSLYATTFIPPHMAQATNRALPLSPNQITIHYVTSNSTNYPFTKP